MRIEDHLSKEQKQQLNNIGKKKKQKRKRKQAKVNWKEIMGVYRDTYERRNGAVRRK
jgi:hypothetical protein